MNKWPTAWREMTLQHAHIEVSKHALDVLRDWQASTPTQPWTNNPLGLPALGNYTPEAMGTPYGAFPTHASFRAAFKRLVDRGGHMPLAHALQDGTSVAKAWRTINGLNLPGSNTETDYPAVLLDRVDESYRTKLQTVPPEERKSVGGGPGLADMSHGVQQATAHLRLSSRDMRGLNEALRYVMKGLS